MLGLSQYTTSANAVLVTARGHNYGVAPLSGVNPASIPGASRAPRATARAGLGGVRSFDAGGPLFYHGGPVMHSVTTHVIYWDPAGEFTATTKEIFKKF